MARLGVFFIIVAVIAMAALIVLPVIGPFRDNSLLMSLQAAINCPPGYTFENEFDTYRPRPGETVESATGYCISPDGDREQLTEDGQIRFLLIAVAAFVVPFLIGLFMLIGGMSRNVTKRAMNYAMNNPTSRYANMMGISSTKADTTSPPVSVDPQLAQMIQNMTGIDIEQAVASGKAQVTTFQSDNLPPSARFSVGGADSTESLTERLRQLEEAKNAGLITQEEYDQKRREILDAM